MLVIMDINKLALDQVLRDVRARCTHGTDKACTCKFYVADAIQTRFGVDYEHATDLAAALWANEPQQAELPDYPQCLACGGPADMRHACRMSGDGDHRPAETT